MASVNGASVLSAGGDGLLRAEALSAFPWLRHGFGTRHSPAWTEVARTATLRQVHSDLVIDAGDKCGTLGEGDALITNRTGVWLAVRTADCVPILMADPVRRVVAAVHAGWRGTAARIAPKAVERMRSDHGSAAEDIVAVIGPAIGVCCYQVGPDVLERFREWLPRDIDFHHPGNLNLEAVNRSQLSQCGVKKIQGMQICTQCDPQLFHSFRRDRDAAGRMVTAIAMVDEASE